MSDVTSIDHATATMEALERDPAFMRAYVSQLQAEVEALRRDAERYRWLRTRINWSERKGGMATARTAPIIEYTYREWAHQDYRKQRPESEHIDDYIDAAIDAARGQGLQQGDMP